MPAPATRHLGAVALTCIALLLFALLDATAKSLGQHHPVGLLVWARYTTHLSIMVIGLAPFIGRTLIRTAHLRAQVLRGLFLTGTTLFSMAALVRLPLADATALFFTAPLIVAVLAGPMLGERIGRTVWIALGLGFAGALLLTRPGSMPDPIGVALAICTALLYSLYQLYTRRLAGLEPPLTLLFYSALVGTLASTLMLPLVDTDMATVPPGDLLRMASLGVYGGCGHLLLIVALREVPASWLAPVMYLQLVWATAIGWQVFDELPDAIDALGMSLIGLAGISVALAQRRRSVPHDPDSRPGNPNDDPPAPPPR